ncbi:sodium-dependent transporter, partial [Raoultibacter massiliensis]|uniref:sodium-dependent transporter n=1 Tax=Raoultibacter massiliensis TaxID=1852371 RepID=UPI003A8E3236
LQKGVERITKAMMACLFVIMAVLCVRSVTLEGGGEGLAFYLIPDFSRLLAGATTAEQLASFGEAVYAAMGQAFFTLSLGISAMAIFGSYIGKVRRLTGEALSVGVLDTLVAFMAGLIIFPACFAFGVNPGEGPSLVFVTLPSVFEQMWMGQLWGTLFFLFMSFAALSTIIAVFENLLSFSMDLWGWSRKKAVLVNGVAVILLSLPCALGFNVLSGAAIPGIGDIQSIEDFIVSNNILPIGSLIYVLFCTSRRGWGWKNFIAEADTGKGIAFPKWAYLWVKFGIPTLIVVILVMGYIPKFQVWFG